MSDPAQRFRPRCESLETRETPSAGFTETFDTTAPPGTPAGWQSWSDDAQGGFITSRLTASSGTTSLAGLGDFLTQARFWNATPQPGDTTASAKVRSDGPSPVLVIARGEDLDTTHPSYLAAVVFPGAWHVRLIEVRNGTPRTLGTIQLQAPVYGAWLTVTLDPTGGRAAVRVQRSDTGQFLNSQGTWQAASENVIAADVLHRPTTGLIGIGRSAGGQGMVFVDDIEATPPVVGVRESFDGVAVGAIPSGWGEWASDGTVGFGVSNARAASTPNGFLTAGTSATSARAWVDASQPADVQASASVFVDSLIPGTVVVRGANLNTPQPTYYGLKATRGAEVTLVRVVNGVETPLASVRSTEYASGVWLRLTLTATGDRLRAVVFRPDTDEWLTPDGAWTDAPQPALEATDTAIRSAGLVGLARSAAAAGAITFDDVEVMPAALLTGPAVTVTASQPGTTYANDVTFRATATPAGAARRVEFRLDGRLRAAFHAAPAEWTLDTTLLANGEHELVVWAVDAGGNVGTATLRFTTNNANPNPPPERPSIPRHYSHVRVAQLAYAGNPMGPFEQSRLRDSVDLVIPNTAFLSQVNAVAPNTPQLIYTNLTNVYAGLLTDWLTYADRTGSSRELAFYHVTQATPFQGGSSGSQPVTKLWGVYRGSAATPQSGQTDLTSAAFGGRLFGVSFGGTGEAVSMGYPDKFRELNVSLTRGAAVGWNATFEYVSAVAADGTPTAWKPLPLLADGSALFTGSGRVTFNPPADWVAARVGGSDRLFYVRVRTTSGTSAMAPEARTIIGRDYVGANGRLQGTIPAFDSAADRDGDGYLNDAEYATRTAGKDARFLYESRLFYPNYGQMRFVTNPSSSAARRWAADYHDRLLDQTPLADGFFLDNSSGRLPFTGTAVAEATDSYSDDSANLVAAVWRAIAPKIVVANTTGGRDAADGIAEAATGVFEEFVLRPTEATWAAVTDVANLVASRLGADSPPPYVILDSHSGGLPTTSNRVRTGVLAYYYLLADADRTMLMFFGGQSPSAPWSRTWIPAVSTNVGTATGEVRTFATGRDPQNAALEYKVFARDYSNALVLFKPRSYALGAGTGTLDNATATTHELGGNYRVLNGDGTRGPVVQRVTLRNGEGAVLLKA